MQKEGKGAKYTLGKCNALAVMLFEEKQFSDIDDSRL